MRKKKRRYTLLYKGLGDRLNVNDVEQIKNMDKDIRFVNYCGKEVWSKFVSFSVGVSSVIKNYMVFIGEPPVMQGYAPDNIIGRKLYGEKGKLFCVRIEFYRVKIVECLFHQEE